MDAPTRVFVLDDHPLVRQALQDLLADEPGLELVGEAAGATEAINKIDVLEPTVALLDVHLDEALTGIDVCRAVRSHQPRVICLMLSGDSGTTVIRDAMAAGAVGYLLKGGSTADLISGIRQAAAGERLFKAEEVVAEQLQEVPLGPQEAQILRLIAAGRSNRQIAAEMYLAEKTVKNYITGLFAKLGCVRRTQAAAAYALRSN